ncbi:MAG: MarR family transcriptional regulator [Streptosporangiaceae bacterium]|nr:MarR family transcriptional regulator [Streptosporangiaceae bacterium]MBV9855711.1 MarR family transcriptional regulator [Streptosporangiaceae bacterium]
MTSVSPVPDREAARRRHRRSAAVRRSLRDIEIQLALLNRQVGGRLGIRDPDYACLDLISRYGPLSPSALARRAGLHPATLTGLLDRLERAGWIARERDPTDRRAVTLRVLPGRTPEVLRLYAGMNSALDEICAGYSDGELELIARFLRQVADAGAGAAAGLAEG